MNFQRFIAKRFKFKRYHKQLYRLRGFYSSGFNFSVTPFLFIKLKSSCRFNSVHFEVCRRVLKQNMNKKGHIEFYSHCNLPVSLKKSGTRMGKGKGPVEEWYSLVKSGFLFSSVANVSSAEAYYAARKATKKFPVGCKVLKNNFKFYRSYKNLVL